MHFCEKDDRENHVRSSQLSNTGLAGAAILTLADVWRSQVAAAARARRFEFKHGPGEENTTNLSLYLISVLSRIFSQNHAL